MLRCDRFNNLEIIKGDNAIFQLTLNNYSFREGDRVFFSVKNNKYDKEYIMNIPSHRIFDNVAKFFITEKYSDIEAGNYFFDIEVRTIDGRIDTVILGKFKVIGDVTND
ncbi:MAG: hypothetical protein R3Y64_07710 [Peptostreptococcaceae bacterium]